MSVSDVIKRSFLDGFTQTDITTAKVLVTLGLTVILALYIFFVYRYQTRSVFYSKEFNVSMAAVSVVTASIVLAIQSNVVVSLGMVGALSIVRFRNAVKNPMDLLYLFWSISCGIVCGAGLYEIAVITCIVVTILILLLDLLPAGKPPYLLVVNASVDVQEKVLGIAKTFAKGCRVKSRSWSQGHLSMILELRTAREQELLSACEQVEGVETVSLMSYDGEVRS